MDIIVSDNQANLNKKIEEIFIENLINKFINLDNIYPSMELNIFNIFYGDYLEFTNLNILMYYNKSYDMDYKLFLHISKIVKEYMINYDDMEEEDFCNMFDMDKNTEKLIINSYCFYYIHTAWNYLEHKIIHIFKKLFKYNSHKNKHIGLINLYTKLDIKNKQKKTISRLLNNKFDTDILDNILDCY